jgi:hypothetical protein
MKTAKLAAAAALALLTAACHDAAPPPPPAPPPPAVTVTQPAQKEVIDWDEYPGRVEAKEMVEIKARVSGYLQSINFKDGAEVTRGETLFLIDPRPCSRPEPTRSWPATIWSARRGCSNRRRSPRRKRTPAAVPAAWRRPK